MSENRGPRAVPGTGRYTIRAASVFLEDGVWDNGRVTVEDGVILPFGEEGGQTVDLGPLTLAPGFLDIHVHGGKGTDVMDCDYDGLNALSIYKLEEGVTGFCPTTVTASRKETESAVSAVRYAMDKGVDGAAILGAFLEGPFLSALYKGAQNEQHLRAVDMDELAGIIAAADGTVLSVALAPELDGATEAIDMLRGMGINVRIGHSAATYEQAAAAITRGANLGVHVFNAMSPFRHRDPGVTGAFLNSREAYCEVICDLVHTHPAAIGILLKCKGPERVVLVTDCMRAGGLPDGDYALGGLPVSVKHGECRLENGSLAGSTLRMNDAVRNVMSAAGVSLYDAVRLASATPARALGLNHLGGIAPGKQADLIALDDRCNIHFVMTAGKIQKQ